MPVTREVFKWFWNLMPRVKLSNSLQKFDLWLDGFSEAVEKCDRDCDRGTVALNNFSLQIAQFYQGNYIESTKVIDVTTFNRAVTKNRQSGIRGY